MSDPLELVIDCAAAYRLTKLVTDDSITQEPRDAIIRWAYRRKIGPWPIEVDGTSTAQEAIDRRPPGTWQDVVAADADPPKLAELITCRWCAGMYVAAGIVAVSRLAPRTWRPLARLLALSAAAAWLARIED